MTDKSELEDEDKVLYNVVGKSEIHIDKVLTNLLTAEEYATTRNIIKFDLDDEQEFNVDAFSTGSKNTKYSRDFLSTNTNGNN
mmetsp:Transcript_37316/g.27545  ORF Transcript_37316/g.27545 Transcript_37316/m.27545 type:complete len:83 (-) Transcript_37316:487-735(-)|eukprot:CAMPEP_0202980242 /NCGR_PEP_ID=MMETSP1396-20130829/86197_1 /ASSEMBLY_ACC=CAM_ASM_000872 /TAXON_ID= /ORGANISM="Pseudokeronopsis sp., Strain Brazil" /LENGTH=82 /DNA_ID=CAMNT_0049720081 /DNA_START=663 /DNA_END=911 /DNA_ORIENTATION=-